MSEPRIPVPLLVLKRFWLALTIVLLVVGSLAYWVKNAFYDTGYAPEQPIAFYHKVHAGELKIDCKYCHFNAERGKHAGIPPMSVCMGCHAHVVTENAEYQREIANLIKVADTGSYQIDGKDYHGTPDGVVYDGGVVHWKRVHKLPDHVYFSHQWHVTAGVACQTCHGPVEEMTVMRQFSDLTMEWCLDCHRRSNYVGGRRYDPADPTTFSVGSADRQTQRNREEADPVVAFAERATAARVIDAHPRADIAEPAPAPVVTSLPHGESDRGRFIDTVVDAHDLPPALREAMKAKSKNLPIWRLADLPETHRKYYQNENSFQNAPTQCNTCHQ
ncbi:MAG: cytochrome c3 family protein [Planctomycetes bacterium]|nr:cytochrome c3 family protein [Planctomycetota bacterium]